MVTMNKKNQYISYLYSLYALCPAYGLPGNIKYLWMYEGDDVELERF